MLLDGNAAAGAGEADDAAGKTADGDVGPL